MKRVVSPAVRRLERDLARPLGKNSNVVDIQNRAYFVEKRAPLRAVGLFRRALKINLKDELLGTAEQNLLDIAQILDRFPARKKEAKALRRQAGLFDLTIFCKQITAEGANLELYKDPYFDSYHSFVSQGKGEYLRYLFKGERPYRPWKIRDFISFLKKEHPALHKAYAKRLEALAEQQSR